MKKETGFIEKIGKTTFVVSVKTVENPTVTATDAIKEVITKEAMKIEN